MFTLLLGMDDVTANLYRHTLMSNSQRLSVMDKSVPLFHNLIQALERYQPDIFYLNIRATRFDASTMKEKENEIVDMIYKIKENVRLNQIRIAVQATSQNSLSFLNQLAVLNVWDIFYSPNGNTDLTLVAKQLSKPSSISNVAPYLSTKENTRIHIAEKNKDDEKKKNNALQTVSKNQERKKLNSDPAKEKVIAKKKIDSDKKKTAYKKVKKSQKPPIKKKKKLNLKPFVLIGLIMLLLIGAFRTFYSTNTDRAATNQSTTSYQDLLSKKQYVKAVKLYPDRGVEIENKVLSDTEIKDKAKIVKKIMEYNTSDPIRFDNYYFEQKYDKAAYIYNTSDNSNLVELNTPRRIMVAYSLMKNGQEDKALKVAEPLNNSALTKRIKVYKDFFDANTILEQKIKKGELKGDDLEKAKEQIAENKRHMDRL